MLIDSWSAMQRTQQAQLSQHVIGRSQGEVIRPDGHVNASGQHCAKRCDTGVQAEI